MEPMGMGRSRHELCTSKRLDRLGNLLSCHHGGEMGFTENFFFLIKWGALNITHTYKF